MNNNNIKEYSILLTNAIAVEIYREIFGGNVLFDKNLFREYCEPGDHLLTVKNNDIQITSGNKLITKNQFRFTFKDEMGREYFQDVYQEGPIARITFPKLTE